MKLFKNLGFITKTFFLLGIIMLIPLLLLIVYPEESKYSFGFLLPAFCSFVISALIEINHKRKKENFSKSRNRQQHVVIVVCIWLSAFLLGALPFYLTGNLTFLKSLFESVSGWTTTGFTTVNVAAEPKIFLFFRSFMQFCGGLGFVLLMLFFAGGTDAMKMFSAEGHTDKLERNLKSTARTIMYIYLGLLISGIILFAFFGMDLFDAVCHAMGSIATGGFSTHSNSIGYYNSIPIEITCMVLMLFGATNFAFLALIIKGKFKAFIKIGELRFFIILITIAITFLTVISFGAVYSSFGESVRLSAFHAVSAITTTGYSLKPFKSLNPSADLIFIILMLIGGGSGSTSGGLKYSRLYIMFKAVIFGIKTKFMPERSINTMSVHKYNGKVKLTTESVLEIQNFIFVYLVTFLIGTFALTLNGASLGTALFNFASCLGTVGLNDSFNPAVANSFTLIITIFGMILARLEVYIIYIFFVAGFGSFAKLFKKRKKFN